MPKVTLPTLNKGITYESLADYRRSKDDLPIFIYSESREKLLIYNYGICSKSNFSAIDKSCLPAKLLGTYVVPADGPADVEFLVQENAVS